MRALLFILLFPVIGYCQPLQYSLLASKAVVMTSIAPVSSTFGQAGVGNTAATISFNTAGGKFGVAVVCSYASTTGTLANGAGDTWTAGSVAFNGVGAAIERTITYYCSNVTSSATYTMTYTNSASFPALFVATFSGVLTTSPYDGQHSEFAGSLSTSNATQPGSITPGHNGDLVIAGYDTNGGGGAPWSVSSPYTILQSAQGTAHASGGAMAYLVQLTAAATNPTGTYTGSPNTYNNSIIWDFQKAP